MMNSLTMLFDPHTNYLSPENSENFNTSMTNKFQGIGAELQTDDDYTKVARLIPGSPAEKQGQLKPNDKIVWRWSRNRWRNRGIIGWRLTDVVKKIKGPKETIVRLEVIAADPTITKHKIISIKRDTIELKDQEAQKALLTAKSNGQTFKVGIIEIPAFYMDFDAYNRRDPNYGSVTRDVYRLIDELHQENVDGIVIDLRNNWWRFFTRGGHVDRSVHRSSPVVQIRQSDDTISRDYRATHQRVSRPINCIDQ